MHLVYLTLVILLTISFISESSNVCFPSFEKRAFVTTLSNTHDNLLKIKVLYKSLRMNKAKEDVVVIVPEAILTSNLQKQLSSFGFLTYPIKKKMLEQHNNPQGLSVWAFEMTQYERLVYLDPYSLVLDNVDELFACAGYCASLNSKSEESPVVLEPSLKTFTSLTHNFHKSSGDFMVSLQQIMNLESCPTFSQHVVANAETTEQCFNREANLLTECHQLPVEYGVLSGDFAAQSIHKDMVCTICGFEKPKIIMYPGHKGTWESFMKTRNPIVSKWDNVRSTIPISPAMRKDAFLSFSVAICFCFFVLYFHDQRYQLGKSRHNVSFAPSLSLSAFPEPSHLSGTALVCESLSCALGAPPSPNTRHGIASRSSVQLLVVVLLTVVVASIWYHLSLTIGKLSSSFEWDPLASLAVGYSWTTLFLLTGLQLMDHGHDLFHGDVCELVREAGLALLTVLVILIGLPQDQHVFCIQVMFCVLAVVSSVSYLRRPPTATPLPSLVQSQDISVILGASLGYYVMSYLLVLLHVPIVLRTVIVRSMGMLHFSVVIFVVITVVCGDHLSDIIRKATSHKRNSNVNVVQYLHRISKFVANMCCFLKTILLQPVSCAVIVCMVGIVFLYIKLFVARGSNLPHTSPYFCLHQRGKYLNAEGGVSSGCGAREAFSIEYPENSVYSETFSQKYICIENTKPVPRTRKRHYNNGKSNWWDLVLVTNLFGDNSTNLWQTIFGSEYMATQETEIKKYLFPSLLVKQKEHLDFRHCVPDTQFVFILPRPAMTEDSKKLYCLYNSRNGNFLTSSTSERHSCGQTEKWEVVPTHWYIYVLNKITHVLYPLKYRFTYLNPFLSVCLMVLLTRVAQKVCGVKIRVCIGFVCYILIYRV